MTRLPRARDDVERAPARARRRGRSGVRRASAEPSGAARGIGRGRTSQDDRGARPTRATTPTGPAPAASATDPWGCSSAGRAPRSHRGGQGFESPHLHHPHSNRRRLGRRRRVRRARRAARSNGRAASGARPCDPGRREATTAQNRGPWPNTRRWASSWMTTVSSASGGARISRHEKASRPWREALPQRVRWSRMLIAAGVTPRAAACRRDLALDRGPGARLEPRLEDGRDRPPVGRREVDDRSRPRRRRRSARRVDRRAPVRAGTHAEAVEVAPEPDRRAVAQPAAGRELGPLARLAWRGGGAATARARPGTRRRAARGRAQPRRPAAGTVTTTPRSGWITTRRPRDRGERRSV